jgi:hypothetical protein
MNRQKSLKLFFACFVTFLLLGSNVFPAHSQQVVEFTNHQAVTTFLENIRFTVDLCGLPPKATVNLQVRFSHDAWELIPAFVDKATADSCARGRYTYPMKDYPPFIPVEYYWQVYLPGNSYVDGPHQSTMYEDTRYQWKKLESDHVTLFWHDRPEALGQQILEIAEKADQAQQIFFGLELKHPYRIVIFNSADEFFGWNVDSSDYVAGESYPFFDLTVQIVEDDSLDWLEEVIPHEISHLYFDQAAYHPSSDTYPPSWLDEGVAVYNEFTAHEFEETLMREAVVGDRLIPLGQLAGSFGEDPDRVDLAYAEGYSAVSYLMEVYGRDTLKELMSSYRRGDSTEQAFNAALDKPFTEFEAGWKDWLKEKYTADSPPEIIPFPTQESPAISSNLLPLIFCGLGLAPFFCFFTLAGGAGLFLMIRRPPRV